MKICFRNVAVSALATILMLAALLTAPLSAAASARETGGESGYDFSVSGSSYTEVFTPSELLSLLGAEPSSCEAQYVDRKSTLSLSFDTGITTEYVHVLLPDNSDELSVLANPYSYLSDTGFNVTWVPTSAVFDGVTADFIPYDGALGYDSVAAFKLSDGETLDSASAVDVIFTADFTLLRADVNTLLNLAYNDASFAKAHLDKEREAYDSAKKEHDEASARFADYTVAMERFAAEDALFRQYLKDLEDYNGRVEAREEYERAMDEFERLTEEYRIFKEVTEPAYAEAYAAYLAYKTELDRYNNELLPAYLEAEERYNLYHGHLDIIEMAKIPMTDSRTLYDAIMGSTVTEVLSRQDEIIAAGATEELVEIAGVATEKLRTLFTAYFSLRTSEDKYLYYSTYYKDFRDNIYDLLRALDSFYTLDNDGGLVRTALVKEDKAKKYVILLAQLYVMADALYDGRIYTYPNASGVKKEFTDAYKWSYSRTWAQEIGGNATVVTPITMLEGERYLADTDAAAPFEGQFPELPEKPTAPDFVAEPEPLEIVTEPEEPEYVAEAGDPPPTVEEPKEPEHVDDPGEPPVPYTPTEDELLLTELLASGELLPRSELSSDYTYKAEITLKKSALPTDITTVYFYSAEDSPEPIYTTAVDTGTAVSFRGELPRRPADERFSYTFSHWVDENGNQVDLSSAVGSHLYLYPSYNEIPVTYKVTWNVDGVTSEELYTYGEIPSFDGLPEREKDASFVYVFIGWQGGVKPVSSDVTYVAEFKAIPYYNIEWIMPTGAVFTECLATDYPIPPDPNPTKEADTLFTYSFSGWDKPLSMPTEDTAYTALFDADYILPVGSGGAYVTVDSDALTVDASGTGGRVIDLSPVLEMLLQHGLILITDVGRFTFAENTVARMLSGGAECIVTESERRGDSYGYAVDILDADGNALLPAEPYLFDAAFNFDVTYDYSMRLYYTDSVGEKKTVSPISILDSALHAKKLSSGIRYSFGRLRTVRILPTDGVEISAKTLLASVGERVEISAITPEGMSIIKLVYIDASGKEHAITDGGFIMPDSDVKIWGSSAPITFKVSFVNYDGKSIERICKWGEVPTPPKFIRNPDDKYSYTFVGWDAEITAAYSDATYTAVYESEPLPEKNDSRKFDSFGEKIKYYATLYAIYAYRYRRVLIISFGLSLVSLALFIAKKKYRKKHPIS